MPTQLHGELAVHVFAADCADVADRWCLPRAAWNFTMRGDAAQVGFAAGIPRVIG